MNSVVIAPPKEYKPPNMNITPDPIPVLEVKAKGWYFEPWGDGLGRESTQGFIVKLQQVNPDTYTGIELIVHPDGKIEKTEMEFDEEIFDDLAEDDFIHCNVLEFQMHLAKTK